MDRMKLLDEISDLEEVVLELTEKLDLANMENAVLKDQVREYSALLASLEPRTTEL